MPSVQCALCCRIAYSVSTYTQPDAHPGFLQASPVASCQQRQGAIAPPYILACPKVFLSKNFLSKIPNLGLKIPFGGIKGQNWNFKHPCLLCGKSAAICRKSSTSYPAPTFLTHDASGWRPRRICSSPVSNFGPGAPPEIRQPVCRLPQ